MRNDEVLRAEASKYGLGACLKYVYVNQGFFIATLKRMYCLRSYLMQLNKDTNDLLWLAIVGLTDQYIHQVCGQYFGAYLLGTRNQCQTELFVFHRQLLARGYCRLSPPRLTCCLLLGCAAESAHAFSKRSVFCCDTAAPKYPSYDLCQWNRKLFI